LFFDTINNQATNGQKDDQRPKYVRFMCIQLPIWYMLIRQVAALRHVKN